MQKEKLLISACFMGQNVKYNGKNNFINTDKLQKKYELFSICPEVIGGLDTPRLPSEILSYKPLKIINSEGLEVTDAFVQGAKEVLAMVKKEGISKALLKSNSPSCSSSLVYDGNFSAILVEGVGITTLFLEMCGVKVFDENGISQLLK